MLGIDVKTKHVKLLIRGLRRLKSTLEVDNGGMYREDNNYSQVHVNTNLNEQKLNDWLYKYCKKIEYIGVFEIEVTL